MTTQSSRVLALSFLRDHPDEAAALLELQPAGEVATVLVDVPPELAAVLLQKMTGSRAAACLGRMSVEATARAANLIPPAGLAAILRQLEPSQRDSILAAMPRRAAQSLQRILSYAEGTAGALMDPRAVAFPQDITVENARGRLRRTPARSTYYLYIVDRDQRLVGVLTTPELFLADRQNLLSASMHSPVERLPADANQRMILDHPGWRAYHALPVVDHEGRLVGAIHLETARALEREMDPRAGRAAAMDTAMRLGELLWIALAGLITGLAGHDPATGPVDERVRRE
jgi:magnesium transporter